MQGRAKLIEDHEDLHRQTGDIKARFAKLNQIIKKRDLKAQREEERQHEIDVAERLVKTAMRVRPGRNLMSSDDEPMPETKKRNKGEMHGATVVPEPAYLRHKKLLDKKF